MFLDVVFDVYMTTDKCFHDNNNHSHKTTTTVLELIVYSTCLAWQKVYNYKSECFQADVLTKVSSVMSSVSMFIKKANHLIIDWFVFSSTSTHTCMDLWNWTAAARHRITQAAQHTTQSRLTNIKFQTLYFDRITTEQSRTKTQRLHPIRPLLPTKQRENMRPISNFPEESHKSDMIAAVL